MILVITSHRQGEWCGGDSVITAGLLRVWPELAACRLLFSADVPEAETDDAVASCRYIVHAGTPSWYAEERRRFWVAAARHRRRIALLGIGVAVSPLQTWWYGCEAFMRLRETGLVDPIVCRDRSAIYWLSTRLGWDAQQIQVLPCPGLFAAPPGRPSPWKDRVLLSIADPEETGSARPETWAGYWERMGLLRTALAGEGADVTLVYQRRPRPGFLEIARRAFGGSDITWFSAPQAFYEALAHHDVYIGVRNHGAMPAAGAGLPSLLLGTDERQRLADEVPYIAQQDIGHVPPDVRGVLDWWRSLDALGMSRSLVEFRTLAERRWREVLTPLQGRLTG